MKAIIFLCCLFLMTPFGFAQKDKKTSTTETVEKEIRQREELGTTKSVRGDSNWDGLWAALMEIEIETAEKKQFSYNLRFMNVWKKFDDGWQIVAAERTPVRPTPK